MLPDLIERGIAVRRPETRGAARRHADEALWIGDGKRTQQQAVDERENRGVRADAERERKDRDGRHDGRRAERAKGEAEILHGKHGDPERPYICDLARRATLLGSPHQSLDVRRCPS